MDDEIRDNISYDYMLCDDDELFRTHTPDLEVELPDCTKMDLNYYVVNGMYYTEYDGQTALKAMNQVISARETKVVLKYSDESVYKTAKEDILNNEVKRAAQNLAQWYHLTEVSYSYIDDKKIKLQFSGNILKKRIEIYPILNAKNINRILNKKVWIKPI